MTQNRLAYWLFIFLIVPKADRSMGIRVFRYAFELKSQNIKSLKPEPIVIELPNPYIIMLEEDNNVPEAYEVIIRNPVGEHLSYRSRVLKYWEYDLDLLYKNNIHLLFPLKVFQARKKIDKAKYLRQESAKYDLLIKEIKDDIVGI